MANTQPTRQQEKRSFFIQLPVELLGLVFDHAEGKDLLAVACTCKLIHSIVEPHLYHSVVTQNQERLACFRRALIRNPAYAKLVRSFEVYRESLSEGEGPPPNLGLDLLGDLPKLECLVVDAARTCISVLDVDDALAIAGHLPLLTTCEINIRSIGPYYNNLGYLETLLTWPTLTTLTLHNMNTADGVFNDDTGATSKIRTLRLFSSSVDPTSLHQLMSAMENLEELVIHSMSGIELYGELHQELSDPSGYDQALEPVSTTLKFLILVKEHGQPCERPLRLKDMTALEYVSADLDLWFGYDFVSYTISRETVLQEMFPPGLKTMRIGGWKGGSGAMGLNRRYSEDDIKAYILKTMMYSVGRFAPVMEHIEFEKDWDIGKEGIIDLPEELRKFRRCFEAHGISVSMTEWDPRSSRFVPVGSAPLPVSEDFCPA